MAEPVEPERADPTEWLPWIATVAAVLLGAMILTIWWAADGNVGLKWTLLGVALLLLATLGLPAWAVFGNRS